MTQPIHAILVDHAVGLVRPLTDAATDAGARQRLLDGLGWHPSALGGFDLDELATALDTCRSTVDGLVDLIDGGLDDISDAVDCFNQIRAAVAAVIDAVEGWRRRVGSSGSNRPAPPDAAADPYALLLSDLFCHLLDAHLAIHAPRLRVALDLVGVRRMITPSGPVEINGLVVRDARARAFYDIGPLGDLLDDPVGTIKARIFGSGGAPADPDALADRIGPLVAAWLGDLGIPAVYGTPGAQSPESGLTDAERAAAAHLLHVDSNGVAVGRLRLALGLSRDVVAPATTGPLVAVVLPSGEFEARATHGGWRVDTTLEGATSPVIFGRHGARFEPPNAAGSVRGTVALTYGDPDGHVVALRFGSPDGTRLEINAVRLVGTATVDASGITGAVDLALSGARLLIEPGEDGFLAAVLPKQPIVIDLDLGVGWSPAKGLTLKGSARLDHTFPVGRTLGPLSVHQVRVALGPADAGGVALTVTADLSVRLGPVTATVDGLGLRAALAPAHGPGALGPFDVDIAAVRPTGVGLAVDPRERSPLTGGGYLRADHATGQYAGAVQLKFGALQLAAIGLLSTRMPDGSAGFSLLVLISARFPPVQLGFGLSLTGVGGLLGVNRSVDVAALRSGLEAGSLDGVLFPENLVANAQRVATDLGTFFPMTVGQFVVGPTVELTWGAQGMVTAQLGLFIEFPSPTRVVLAGRLRLVLPPGQPEPVVRVQVDLIGALDFSTRSLAIDGVLRDSRIANFTLTGGLAVRATWGDRPAFLVSVGGYNPRFRPPAKFPALKRLALALGEEDNPRLRLAAYLALTSNTVQFGARLDVYASASVPVLGTFAISGVLGFDALIILDPLSFVVDIYAAVALHWDGDPVFAVALDLTLSGPRPWRALGRATFELFGTHSVDFDVTVGRRLGAAPPPTVDLATKVRDALQRPENWTAELPADGASLVTLADRAHAEDAILLHPLGSLTGVQRIAPLERELDRYGPARLTGTRPPFVLGKLTVNGAEATTTTVDDSFAIGEYLDITDAERLSLASFDRLPAGVRVDDRGLTMPATPARVVSAKFRQQRVNADGSVTDVTAAAIPEERMRLHAAAGAAAVNGAHAQAEKAFQGAPRTVRVAEPRYAVVRVVAPAAGLVARLEPRQTQLTSVAEARDVLRALTDELTGTGARLRLVDNDEIPRG